MSFKATEDAGGGGGDGGEEYKTVYRGKGLTEMELQDRKRDEEQKMHVQLGFCSEHKKERRS